MTDRILSRIAEARQHASYALRFGNFGPERLASDIDAQRVILFTLVLLAQALSDLPSEVRSLAPEIPFAAIRGLRNRIVHSSDQIDYAIIAEVLRRDIPELLRALDRLETLLRNNDLT